MLRMTHQLKNLVRPATILIFILIASFNAVAVSFQPVQNNMTDATVFANLKPHDFTRLTGRKLSVLEKVYLKSAQKKIKRKLKKEKTVHVQEYYDPQTKTFKLDSLWFVLGILIGPFALLFSLTTKQKKNARKSALLGFGVFVLWFGYLFLF